MPSLKQLQQRIKSAKSIRQITRAMKLVAAARLRRAQDRVLEARPYSDKMRELIASLAEAGDMPDHPLLARRAIKKYGVVIITADRGLCGSFNSNIIRKAVEFIKNTPGDATIISVGRKSEQFFKKRGYSMGPHFSLPTSGPTHRHSLDIFAVAQEAFRTEQLDAIYLVYSKFFSAIRQIPEVVQLLPILPPQREESGENKMTSKSYAFEPNATELLSQLLPRYALTVTLQGLLESTASEHGARMTAMTSATDSAGEMISTLTLQANRSRQAAITKEILEIVGGAEALKS